MWLALAAVVGGLALLVFSADRFVDAAASAARRLGVSPLIVGLTVVAFGTSAPEVAVSVLASLQGNTGIAIGNAVGSNITNIGLIVGLAALITPLIVARQLVRRELPILIGVSLLAVVLMIDGQLGRIDGAVLIIAMLGFLAWLGVAIRQGEAPAVATDLTPVVGAGSEPSPGVPTEAHPERQSGSLLRDIVWIVVGLLLLVAASRALVWGAVEIAEAFGVPELVIGLTIVAIGTSLPELATSIVAAFKREADIAVGNVVGSNIFNTLFVLPMAGLIAPGAIDSALITRDLPWMLGFTVALVVFAWIGARAHGRARQISRIEGALLLAAFIGYLVWLVYGSLSA